MDTTTQEAETVRALAHSAKALAGLTGLTEAGISKAIRGALQFAKPENKNEALNETVTRLIWKARANERCQALVDGTGIKFWVDIDYAYIAAKAKLVVNEIHERSKPPLVKKPHRGKRIYLQRAGLTTRGQAAYEGGDRPIEGIAVRPEESSEYTATDYAKRLAILQLAYPTDQQRKCVSLLVDEKASARSVRNIQDQTGLSRREIQNIKDSLPRFQTVAQKIIAESV